MTSTLIGILLGLLAAELPQPWRYLVLALLCVVGAVVGIWLWMDRDR